MHVLCLRHSHPFDDLPLLRITDTRRVEPISQLIGGPSGVMPHQRCCEVLRNPCAFTLSDEPLAGGVEYGAVQFWMTPAQVRIPFHNLVYREM